MSILFKYDDSNNILLVNAGTLQDPKESIAVDALRVIFIAIRETSERLEQRILFNSKTGNTENNYRYTEYGSIIGETWQLIDSIRRLEQLLPYIPGISKHLSHSLAEAFNQIRLVRNSFQHLDERIERHFSNVGGSVFGDLIWRYREEKNERESLNCLVSGVNRHKKHTELGMGPENPEFKDNIGVYDLWLLYIKKDGAEVRISIDQAILKITALLDFLEDKYSRVYESLDKEKKTFNLPYTFQLRVTQKAFDRVNKEN
ncbi:hypothetical protein [Pedobacter hiemivivus]|uniref:Uncharacterized protein n=1 Tax=Pedobacter hiemivivus TaxID=2530454 RepID=A0A4R0NAB1_9SPHI|nr:hypothetical protein [Pedobacter hiemivivus]TCC97188.1 hypothetical protein EZ444_10080 [Pedobacter hiemivivus]